MSPPGPRCAVKAARKALILCVPWFDVIAMPPDPGSFCVHGKLLELTATAVSVQAQLVQLLITLALPCKPLEKRTTLLFDALFSDPLLPIPCMSVNTLLVHVTPVPLVLMSSMTVMVTRCSHLCLGHRLLRPPIRQAVQHLLPPTS